MQKQKRPAQIRSTFQKQTRRDNLSKIFKQHRKTLVEQTQKHDQAQFNSIYPKIDEDNYRQHISFMLKYSRNEHFNYRLVVFGGYLYEELVQHRDSKDALDILEALSQYEEIDVPQTWEFVEVLAENLEKNTKVILSIVANLLHHRKYGSSLRDYLIQQHFVEIVQKILNGKTEQNLKQTKQEETQLFFQILCGMISTHPIIQDRIFASMVKIIKTQAVDDNSVYFLLAKLEDLASTVTESPFRAGLIYQTFQDIMSKEYYNYEWEVVSILHYCLKSKVEVSNQLCTLLAKSLTSPIPHMKEKIINILEAVENSEGQYEFVHTEELFMGNLLKIYESSQLWSKIKIVRFVARVIRYYLTETLTQQEMVQQDSRACILPAIFLAISDSLQSKSNELIEAGVQLTFQVVATFAQQELREREEVIAKMDQGHTLDILSSMPILSGVELKEKIEHIFLLVSQIKEDLRQLAS